MVVGVDYIFLTSRRSQLVPCLEDQRLLEITGNKDCCLKNLMPKQQRPIRKMRTYPNNLEGYPFSRIHHHAYSLPFSGPAIMFISLFFISQEDATRSTPTAHYILVGALQQGLTCKRVSRLAHPILKQHQW